MASAPLSEAAFRERLDDAVRERLTEANGIYRRQRLRLFIIGTAVVLSMALSLLAFFPSLMVVFLLLLYLGYRVAFGKRAKRQRLDVTEDMRRVVLRATLQVGGHPFSLQTHRDMPAFVFKESRLFDFEPDTYASEELVDVEVPGGRLSFARVRGQEHVDAFERDGNDERSFEGWLFRLFPARGFRTDLEGLGEPWRGRLGPDQAWMALPATAPLFRRELLRLSPDHAACAALHRAVASAAARFRITEG